MKKTWINVLLLSSVTAFGLAACDNKGPAEQAGEKFDESVEQVQEKSQELADEAKEGLGIEEKGAMEKAGESIDDAADATGQKIDELTKDNE